MSRRIVILVALLSGGCGGNHGAVFGGYGAAFSWGADTLWLNPGGKFIQHQTYNRGGERWETGKWRVANNKLFLDVPLIAREHAYDGPEKGVRAAGTVVIDLGFGWVQGGLSFEENGPVYRRVTVPGPRFDPHRGVGPDSNDLQDSTRW